MLKVIIFNVERGFCAFVRSPNKYALLVDCGRSTNFSPIKYIVDNEIGKTQPFEDHELAEFICSHPHEDHISDIQNLKKLLRPMIIVGDIFDPWDEIKDPTDKRVDAYKNLDDYAHFRAQYRPPVDTYPEWGMDFWFGGLSIDDAKKINNERHAFVNNSSIAVMLKYQNLKFFFSGDLMEDGWKELLKRPKFRKAIEGTDVFITAHHGHKSGYTREIFDAIGEGKPLINIVSEKSGDDVCNQYSDKNHAQGIDYEGKTRRMFSTRWGGSIIIKVSDEGDGTIIQQEFEDNDT